VTPFLLGGYFLSSIPWVQDNFKKITTAILIISVIPFLYGVAKEMFSKKEAV
jgi:membrane protein DedA with SNARE-associated domain